MRLINVISGKIILDDIELATVAGSVVRQKLICLTRDPFLAPGSIRNNGNPLADTSDSEITSALEKVGLWSVLAEEANDRSVAGVLDTNNGCRVPFPRPASTVLSCSRDAQERQCFDPRRTTTRTSR